ncbi:MAG: hypothetical protein JWL83_11 [Actinomycetia bacterium]|nr:hypothetical protein [Actinomycetes bacterium]
MATIEPAEVRLWRSARWIVGFGVLLVLAPIALRMPNSYDGVAMQRVAVALVDHGTPLVRQSPDQFGLNTPYSGYGIGTSLVMAPLHLVGRVLGDPWHPMNLADGLLLCATIVVVFETLRRRGIATRPALVATALVAFGSPLLAYGITDFSEPGVALAVALIVLSLDAAARATRAAAFAMGAAVGMAVLFRTDSFILVALPAAVALMCVSRRKGRDACDFVFGSAPAMVIWIAYNAARFQRPFSSGYRYQTFSHPFLRGVYGLTLSPGRGIFVYAPILVAALAVLPALRSTDRVIGVFAAVLLVTRVVFFARWWAWYGGDVWGPRFLVPVLPAFAPAIATALARWPRSRLVGGAVVATVSMSVIGVWVTANPELNRYTGEQITPGSAREVMAQVTRPGYVQRVDDTMFSWGHFPFGR